MPSTINADNGVSSGSAGLKSSADSSGVLSLQTNGTTAVTVDTSQNVGVGTASPGVKLDVVGSSGQTLRLRNGSTATEYYDIGRDGADGLLAFNGAQTTFVGYKWSTTGTERMRIDTSGNVGIGTSSPGYRLHVSQSVAGGFAWSAVDNQNSTAGSASGFITIANGAGNYSYFSQGINGNLILLNNKASTTLWTATANPIIFYTNLAEAARINSSGNLLVGTASDAGARIRSYFDGTNVSFGMRIGMTNTTGTAVQFVYEPSTQVGTITMTTSATAYNTSSDYRLKDNIQPMTGALERVAQLKPCTYTWKATGVAGQGFIAHELQAVVPEAVSGEKDAVNKDGSIKPQGIDTSFLVATLTAAIQELNAKVQALESQLAAKG